MPEYIPNVLLCFKHPPPIHNQNIPHTCVIVVYGKPQSPMQEDSAPKLPSTGILHVQQVVGILIYYILVVDSTLLVSLIDLASAQLNTRAKTWDNIVWLLNYAATHPDASITYIISDMCLYAHSDVSYLSTPKARSRAAGNFSLGTNQSKGPHRQIQY